MGAERRTYPLPTTSCAQRAAALALALPCSSTASRTLSLPRPVTLGSPFLEWLPVLHGITPRALLWGLRSGVCVFLPKQMSFRIKELFGL